MTCNPKWEEITRELRPGQVAQDRFDLCVRVFRIKLKKMIEYVKDKKVFGRVKAREMVIEFQKRGLPHAHCLLILDQEDKPTGVEEYDHIVCAELPDPEDTDLYETVTTCMLHGPCGNHNPRAPCTVPDPAVPGGFKCTKGYPKEYAERTTVQRDGYPVYQRRDNGATYRKRGVRYEYTNKDVVPYNAWLCRVFNCHINVEICSTIAAVKYLYKYVCKGHDMIQGEVQAADGVDPRRNEPQRYLDCRYVSASEAYWRLSSFQLQYMSPSVVHLTVHVQNQQQVMYAPNAEITRVLERSEMTTLTEWLSYNRQARAGHPGYDPVALTTLYPDFPTRFVWNTTNKAWTVRQNGDTIGRIHSVSPRDTERYYLRLLLHHVPGATSFEDIRTFENTVYDSYHAATKARGLLETDDEFDNDLRVASGVSSPKQLRELFAMMLMYCEVGDPVALFENYLSDFAEDFTHEQGIEEVTPAIRNSVLAHMEALLERNNFTLAQFPGMPVPEEEEVHLTPADQHDILHHIMNAERLAGLLNEDQRAMYDAVVSALEAPSIADIPVNEVVPPKCFYVDGPAGTGKTFLYSAIIAYAKANAHSVLPTASTGIAALLLEGGRTAHSTFKIPIPITRTSTCDIKVQSRLAERIRRAAILLLDEAPVLHKDVIAALDRTLRDIMKILDPRLEHVPFGGKVILLGGDFRQMLPVIPKATRGTIVDSCINKSELWEHFAVYHLRENLRLIGEQQGWADFLLQVGEGLIESPMPLPEGVVTATSLEDMIAQVYQAADGTISDFHNKAILTPRNKDVNYLNDVVLDAMPGEAMEFASVDVIPPGEVDNAALFPTEYLNTINLSSIPLHKLRLKRNCVVLLLRNLDAGRGLCNGTRLRVDEFFPNLLKVTIVSQGAYFGETHCIPRIALYPNDSNLPFRFKRLQFPVRLAFAMSINKSQGQTLDKIALYLPAPVFAHGHLYVALSRTRLGGHGIVLFDPNGDTSNLSNVVYREVFQN